MLHISYNVEIMKLTLEDLGFGSSDDAFLSLKIREKNSGYDKEVLDLSGLRSTRSKNLSL